MRNTENFDGGMPEIAGPCPHRELCGGCAYNGDEYEDVLAIKSREAVAFFDAQGIECPIEPIRSCDLEGRFRYRNKMEYTFGDLEKGGELQLGMHKKGNYMSIVTVDQCQLVPRDFNRILKFTLDFAREHGLSHYNKKSHKGILRNLIVRRGARTGEILVDIVTSSEGDLPKYPKQSEGDMRKTTAGEEGKAFFDESAWKDGLLALKLEDEIAGIMHTINDGLADAVSCDEQRVLFGRDYYYEEICDLKFKVKIFSFFQTNVSAVERLYGEAISLLSDMEDKTVYDLFCGTGTISQIAAGRAKEVIGIEIVEDSVASAMANAELNGIANCRFICGDVFKVLDGSELPPPDIIIVDPPRMGLRTKTVNKIATYGVPEILYISCNPKTLAMDLADFRAAGYIPKTIKLYDNFCWTRHIEAAALLCRA